MKAKDFIGPLALLLFTVALLLFTCLCILCKRKQRKTRDISRTRENATAGRSHRARPSLGNLCGDVESTASAEDSVEENPNGGTQANRIPVTGHANLVFESDDVGLPPDYDEALKSKYDKVYRIYPSLGSMRRASAPASLPTSSVSPSTSSDSSPNTSLESVESSRSEAVESPPPPYEMAIRCIDSRGHL